MTKQTILNKAHRELGARMVDFGGWDMPVNYGSQIDEHHEVRNAVGMFDVSHMTVVDVSGVQAKPFLQRLLANDVAKLTRQGKALYSCMLNEAAGIVDDLIVYFLDDKNYRLVVNASTRDKDLAWIEQQAESFDVSIDERPGLAMIAVQGPKARQKVWKLSPLVRAGLVSGLWVEPAILAKMALKSCCQKIRLKAFGSSSWPSALSPVAWVRVTRLG